MGTIHMSVHATDLKPAGVHASMVPGACAGPACHPLAGESAWQGNGETRCNFRQEHVTPGFIDRLRACIPGAAVLAATLAAVPGQAVHAQSASAQLGAVETLTSGHLLPEDASERIYVVDAVFLHPFESQVRVYDGASGKFLGLVPAGYIGHMRLSHDGTKMYIRTHYHSRQTRGERTDVVEVWDARALTFEREIVLAVRTASSLPYRHIFRQTSDGKFLLIQNATPAVSVAVVDVEKGVVTEPEMTATAGCWAIIPKPNRPRSFMSICGDGRLLSIDLDENGKLAGQSRSAEMFPVATDPVFITAAVEKTMAHFVSFNGNVYTADFSSDEMKFEPAWSLLDDADKAGGWRPGGYNIADVHHASRRMYVTMHAKGKEGSHKNGAQEIWVYDLAGKKRVARIPGNGAIGLAVAQGSKPRLLTINGGNAYIYDIATETPKLLRTIEKAAELSPQIEPHPVGVAP